MRLVLIGILLAGSSDEADFPQEAVRGTVQAYIDARAGEEKVFPFKDQVADAVLELQQDQVRLVRRIHGYGYFVDVDFHAKGEPAKAYDLDFWLKPAGDKLDVVDVRIHKAPKRDGESWKLVTRSPIPWWWIPATEHPGETEEKRGWQVESAVHEHIATRIKNGVYMSKDDKTGQERALEFVEIHKPIRKLEGKGHFACTDFREAGSKDKFYDLDFWLVEKEGKLEVSEVRIHKEPRQEDGAWVQTPRYDFEQDKVKEVP